VASHVPRKVVTVLKAESLDVDVDSEVYPTPDEFKVLWMALDRESQVAVKCGLDNVFYKEASIASGMHYNKLRKLLEKPDAMRTYYYGKLLKLSSDVARKTFIKSLVSESAARLLYMEDVDAIVMTDKNHLQELVKKMSFTGDGKRKLLQTIAAYGMQVKLMDQAIIDEEGKELSPAVVDMADPRMATTAIQELNKMDNEYGDDKKASSSIESQAQRIKRYALLGDTVSKVADKSAKKLERTRDLLVQRELGEDESNRELDGTEPVHVKEDI